MVTDTNTLNSIGSFSTVETAVYNQVMNYYNFPETVILTSTSSPTQPLAYLNQLNTYANYSSPGSTQDCDKLKDYFVFNSLNCTPYPLTTGTNVIIG